MTFKCQIGKCKQHTRTFLTWDDLLDHMLNDHRYILVNNKIVHEETYKRSKTHKMESLEARS
jgi:hypothetical protein